MRRSVNKMAAFSLPTVLVITVIIALVLLSALSLASLDRVNYALYQRQKQHMLDLHSAIALYCADSTVASLGDSAVIKLFDKEGSGLSVSVKKWGLYELAVFRSEFLPYTLSYITGKVFPSSLNATLYVADRKRPLSFAGSTVVDGVVYIPSGGINYTEMCGRKFTGQEIRNENQHISSMTVPVVDPSSLSYLDSMRRLRPLAWHHLNIPSNKNSFCSTSQLVYCQDRNGILNLHGNAILFADKLTIRKESHLEGVLVFAESAQIENGFEGSIQLFCTDSILVGENVQLHYPSGLLVSNSTGYPCIKIKKGSYVSGYVIALTGARQDLMQKDPCLFVHEGAVVNGLLFSEGNALVSGTVNGTAYLQDCFYEEAGNKYPGMLYNSAFSPLDTLAYPALLSGPYLRRLVKKVY